MKTAARICSMILQATLLACLILWVSLAPLFWILRDGLGPDMVETSGWPAARKLLVGWGLPALVLAASLAGLWLFSRWLDGLDGDVPQED